MIKRLAILLTLFAQTYGMQQSEMAAANPRTDNAARIYKLSLLIDKRDLKSLLPQVPKLMQRLLLTKQTTYEGHNNLKVVFKLAGKIAEVYRADSIGNPDPQFGSYHGSIEDFTGLLNDLYKKLQQQEQALHTD